MRSNAIYIMYIFRESSKLLLIICHSTVTVCIAIHFAVESLQRFNLFRQVAPHYLSSQQQQQQKLAK